MFYRRPSLRSFRAASLAANPVFLIASPLATVTPALASAPRFTPLQTAQQRQAISQGGLFDPDAVSPFWRPEASGSESLEHLDQTDSD